MSKLVIRDLVEPVASPAGEVVWLRANESALSPASYRLRSTRAPPLFAIALEDLPNRDPDIAIVLTDVSLCARNR
jgi:hypothetical protein